LHTASLLVRHHACQRKRHPTYHREAGSSEADLATLGGRKSELGKLVILPKIRDPRFITVPICWPSSSPDRPTALWSLVGLRPGLRSGGANRKREIARKPNPGGRSADGVPPEAEILYRAVTRAE
jgi:hypothetical protein